MLYRYVLFAGYRIPGGGMNDFQGFFETYEDAKIEADELDKDWFEIVDLQVEMEQFKEVTK